jgi:ribosome maturation factor RimP
METTVKHDMTRPPLLDRLSGVIAPAVETLGVSLWGLEFASAGSRMIVRVYIDAENGPDVDLCARVSRHLGAVLDAEDALPGAYILEVSSPGLERRFFSTEQMAAYLGRVVDVRLHAPQEGRRHLRGSLVEAGPDGIVVDEAGKTMRVGWEAVKAAHLVHEFPEGARKG